MKLRIGTRGSKLALWQANHVRDLLAAQGHEVSIHTYKTTGDLMQQQALYTLGEKGLFTKALDDALLNDEVDLAVHSAKDIPTGFDPGICISAVLKREDPRDVLLALSEEADLDNLNRPLRVGTSSLRRQALLRHYAPHVEVALLRGNVDTRVSKLEAGEYDAIILAYAGVKRMGYERLIIRKLNAHSFTPAVAQGAIAITTRVSGEAMETVRAALNHQSSEQAVTAERAFLKKIEGGCHTPVFALATVTGPTLSLIAGLAATDGSEVLRDETEGPAAEAARLGDQLAESLLNKGGVRILHGYREKN